MKNIRVDWILKNVAVFLVVTVVIMQMPADIQVFVLPVIIAVAFAFSVLKAPPVAIAILLYYSMVFGSWFIIAAAPLTVMLARRYQRHRLVLDLNPDHIRRTTLFGAAALVATLPFLDLSFGPWSPQSQGSGGFDSASPLLPEPGSSGELGNLQRFAQWLGFGPGEPATQGPLVPRATGTFVPDDPFNWWLVIGLVGLIAALLLLAWWLWKRIKSTTAPLLLPTAATPLARLEAIGDSIGRPRRSSEGAITYGKVLADQTGDARLAQAGPLVSGQVYESSFIDPQVVNRNLTGIEVEPPPAPPRPPLGERIKARFGSTAVSVKAFAYATLAVVVIAVAALVVIPRLGDLESRRDFRSMEAEAGSGPEQAVVFPLVAEDVDDLFGRSA